ncbi:MAG: MOSC domain-containing protein [Janthinobacterium lividum]
MINIKEIFVYPVKSCRAISVQEVLLTETGLKDDRNWMIVDAGGTFVSQREHPKLAQVQPRLSHTALSLSAPAMTDIDLPIAAGEGRVHADLFGEPVSSLLVSREASAWFSAYLNGDYRLVTRDPASKRLGGIQYPVRDTSPTSFVDNYGILVISEASRDDLNRRLPNSVPMDRFRPNIVIEGVDAYAEDYFAEARTGDVSLRFIDVCYRCNMTTVDQRTAKVGQEPLATLSRYRSVGPGIRFGSYAAVANGIGLTIHASSPLEVELNF